MSPFLAIPAALTLLIGHAHGETGTGRAQEYQVKTRYIASLAEYATWPASALPAATSDPIVLGILGTSPLDPYVRELERKHRIHGHRIEAVFLRQPSEARRCHIVFVSHSESLRLGEVLQVLRGRPVLTIGDTPGYAARGVMINLFLTQDRVLFEINQNALKAGGMGISSHVLKLARIVE